MQTLIHNVSWIYLVALVFAAWLAAVLFIRANRSTVFTLCATSQVLIVFSLLLRLLEWFAPDLLLGGFFISAGLIVACVVLVLLAQVFYTALTGLRLSPLIQMISGAGTFVLILISLSRLSFIRQAYRDQAKEAWFVLYLLLPLLLLLLSMALLGWLIRQRSLNLTNLSFERVMSVLPDEIFVFDREGLLVDHNSRDSQRSHCMDREQLGQVFRAHCPQGCRDLLRALLQPGQRVGGELGWQDEAEGESIWSWRFQAIRDQHGRPVGAILLLTNLTAVRQAARLLEKQNQELRKINQQLSDYGDLIARYAEASTQQEVAAVIDSSIRQRLEQAGRTLDTTCQVERDEQQRLVEAVLRDCRQALQDIRALVGRLTR